MDKLSLSKMESRTYPDHSRCADKINAERLALYGQLLLYGDFSALKFRVDLDQLNHELEFFSDCWVKYQKSKPDTYRVGLSVTSLDGGMSGVPDLQSLQEYMENGGRAVSENEFNVLTDAGKGISSVRGLIDEYYPSIGRSRFVKFGRGGHFPPHRDQSFHFEVPDYFRIFLPLSNCQSGNLLFILEDKVIKYEPGRAYFFNAMKVHSVFSFVPDAITLALSIPLTQENVRKTIRSFEVK